MGCGVCLRHAGALAWRHGPVRGVVCACTRVRAGAAEHLPTYIHIPTIPDRRTHTINQSIKFSIKRHTSTKEATSQRNHTGSKPQPRDAKRRRLGGLRERVAQALACVTRSLFTRFLQKRAKNCREKNHLSDVSRTHIRHSAYPGHRATQTRAYGGGVCVCVECLPAELGLTRVRLYARVLVPPNLYMHTYIQDTDTGSPLCSCVDRERPPRFPPAAAQRPAPRPDGPCRCTRGCDALSRASRRRMSDEFTSRPRPGRGLVSCVVIFFLNYTRLDLCLISSLATGKGGGGVDACIV